MNSLPSTMRLTLVVSLAISLAAMGFSPCLLAKARCGVSAAEASNLCCCGAACDGRCSMACCRAPAPKQDREPSLPKPSDDSSSSLALAASLSEKLDSAAVAEFRHGMIADGDVVVAHRSLLELSIRLNL